MKLFYSEAALCHQMYTGSLWPMVRRHHQLVASAQAAKAELMA